MSICEVLREFGNMFEAVELVDEVVSTVAWGPDWPGVDGVRKLQERVTNEAAPIIFKYHEIFYGTRSELSEFLSQAATATGAFLRLDMNSLTSKDLTPEEIEKEITRIRSYCEDNVQEYLVPIFLAPEKL